MSMLYSKKRLFAEQIITGLVMVSVAFSAFAPIALAQNAPPTASTTPETTLEEDTTPPEITLNGSANVELAVGDTYTEAGATATDDTDGDLTDEIIVGGDTVDTNATGTYTVTYNVTDAAGNAAPEKTRTVSVVAAETETDPETGSGEELTGDDATNDPVLTVTKAVVGTSTAPDTFSFSVNGGASIAFEADGTNEVTVATGTYEVLEVAPPAAFTVTYSAGCSGELAPGDQVTCTITNTSSTTDSSDGASGSDGTNSDDGSAGSNDGTTDDETTSSDGTDGASGDTGNTGPDGQGVEEEDEGEPVPVVSENNIGEDDTPEDSTDDSEEVTGEVTESGSNVSITTGDAEAKGEVSTDVNSNVVRSEFVDAGPNDLDTYTLNATGTNDAVVDTKGIAEAITGVNAIEDASGVSQITTGDATAGINIANVVNSNVVNSDGFLYLKNQKLEPKQSLDLGSFFFPDPAETEGLTDGCSLLSCRAEDVVYNLMETNTATVTNEVIIDAITGENEAEGDQMVVTTGDARGGANVINVVNTNIIDSNYRLLTYNALGDLEGDLILPTEDLFHAFFSRPNGLSHVTSNEGPEAVNINVDNDNQADVNNNLETNADTGDNLNETNFSADSFIKTGKAESESNVLSKVNENIFGGDSMFLQIRVHGDWSGTVHGLPDGLTWDWTPDGIVIYNEDAEIAPSEILPYDADSYSANFTDKNDVRIDNNVNINAVTGKNSMDGLVGGMETGDAVASANVMNVANANIVGTNWTYAVVNIFGDFDGNVAFSATDLGLSGEVVSASDPLAPGGALDYTYTITNNSDVTATGVTLRQTLQKAYATGTTDNQQQVAVGNLAPGESKSVSLEAEVREDLPFGNHSVVATATVNSNESESDMTDNSSLLSLNFEHTDPGLSGSGEDTGTSSDDQLATSTDETASSSDDTASSTDETASSTDDTNDTGEELNPAPTPTYSSGGGSSGGGGGSGSTKTKKVERKEIEVDPDAPPFLVIEKSADVDEDDVVKAGELVDYVITVTNKGGQAYDAILYDILTNPIGSEMRKDSWDLGTIAAGEEIEVTYTTEYDFKTPSGLYTNTASVVAYREADGKENGDEPLKTKDAVHEVEIEGVDLAVGNVGVLAVFPGADGLVSALVAWETSKKARSQVFYGQKFPWNTFNENFYNYGYPQKSFKFSAAKDRHLMILTGLRPGVEYGYRIDAETGEYDAISREYTLEVPLRVNELSLNTGQGFLAASAILNGRVAGASTGPRSAPTPPPYTPPTPTPVTTPAATPEPEPEPEPEPLTTASHNQSNVGGASGGGFLNQAKDTFFSFFR